MIVTADRVIPGDGKTVWENWGVLVSEGRIQRVDALDALTRDFPKEPVEAFPGSTLLPGLVDLHIHLGNWSRRPGDFHHNDFALAYATLENARRVFESGVTTARDVCTKDGLTATLNWAAETGLIRDIIPRIIPCGNGICMTGGHGSEIPVDGGDEVDGPWELRRAIRRKLKCGSQWIKLLTSRRADCPEFSQEELDAAADECHRLHHKIAVHSGVPSTIQMCIDAGFDTIEHGTFLSEDQARQMREKGLAWVPTITPYVRGYRRMQAICDREGDGASQDVRSACAHYKRAAEAYQQNFRTLCGIIGRVGAGTDLCIDEGEGAPVAEELEFMTAFGLEPLEAIRIGTSGGAEILDLQEVTGSIRPGLSADLLVVRGDPSRDIGALKSIHRVYYKGKTVFNLEGKDAAK